MMRAGIALGSNLGDRRATLEAALVDLKALNAAGVLLVSPFIETTPFDCPQGSPLFLNGVVELETSLTPLELLGKLQALELKYGRKKIHAHNAPRRLDLDILYCDFLHLQLPELEIPHPRMTQRAFVMEPLAEIRPDLILPGWQMTCREYLLNIKKNN
jgi:2-amino-4-hydroxy-6-hydroxymethyldihydropteridine diphosphokinase